MKTAYQEFECFRNERERSQMRNDNQETLNQPSPLNSSSIHTN